MNVMEKVAENNVLKRDMNRARIASNAKGNAAKTGETRIAATLTAVAMCSKTAETSIAMGIAAGTSRMHRSASTAM